MMRIVQLAEFLLSSVVALPPEPGSASMGSVWDLVIKGGWVMIPIGLCSLVALTIAVERLWVLRSGRVAPRPILDAMHSGAEGIRALRERCASDPSPLAKVVNAAIAARQEPQDRRDRLVEEAGQRELMKLRQRTRLYSALPQVATMLGLLGTVFGMIRTFTVVAASGEALGKTERLAQGIYEAWTATAAGLAVAIPTLIAYHVILGRIDHAASTIDEATVSWLKRCESPAAAEVSTPDAVHGTVAAAA